MNIIKSIIGISIFFFLAFVPKNAQAQPGGDLPNEEVDIIKIFEAQLAESEKIAISPELPAVDTTTKRQTYEVPPKSFAVDYLAPRIRPVSYKSGDAEVAELYKFYGKLGAGLPASIYGEGSYNTIVKRSDKSYYGIGVDLLHHSANFSNDDVENQRFALTKASGKGTYYFDQGFAVGANLGYTSNKVHYYGYNFDEFFDPTISIPAENVKQLFSTFDFGAKIFNGVQTAGDLNYKAQLDFYTHGDNFAANETGIDLKLNATKWIQEKHSFDLGLRTDFTSYNDTMVNNSTLNNFTLSPAFTFHGDAFKVKVGGKLISHNDNFEPFPDLEVVLNLTGNELALFVGLEGDLRKNTFRSLTTYNPFLHTRLAENAIRNTKYFNAFAGIRGNLNIFEYTLQVGYKPTNDLALFKYLFDGDDIYDFEVVYDDVNIINIGGSIKATPIKSLTMTGTLSYNIFDTQTEAKAYSLPALDANFQALYTSPDQKLRAKANFYLQDGITTNTIGGTGRWDNLNALFDLSVGGEYWFVKNFGAFLDINNILNNKRQRWLYYPTYGLNVLAGVTARF